MTSNLHPTYMTRYLSMQWFTWKSNAAKFCWFNPKLFEIVFREKIPDNWRAISWDSWPQSISVSIPANFPQSSFALKTPWNLMHPTYMTRYLSMQWFTWKSNAAKFCRFKSKLVWNRLQRKISWQLEIAHWSEKNTSSINRVLPYLRTFCNLLTGNWSLREQWIWILVEFRLHIYRCVRTWSGPKG